MTLSSLPAQMSLIFDEGHDFMLFDELVASFDHQQQSSINYLDENSSNNTYPTTTTTTNLDVALSPEDEETLLSLLSENEVAQFNFEQMDHLLDNSDFEDFSKCETDIHIQQQVLIFSPLNSPLQPSDEITYLDLAFLYDFHDEPPQMDDSTSPKPDVVSPFPINKRKLDNDSDDDEEDEDDEIEESSSKRSKLGGEGSNKKVSNKLAAIKYRQKKVREKEELFEKRDAFALRNEEMRKKIEDVQMEISYIKSLLVQALIAKSS